MKPDLTFRSERGAFMLIEAIAYMAVLVLVLGVGTALLYRCWAANLALRRNADNIVAALNAGELWRADIRSAVSPIRAQAGQIRIPSAHGEIVYEWKNGSVLRTASGQPPRVLAHVTSSEMVADKRAPVRGWRWELELDHDRKHVQLKPLFTFEAAAGGAQR